MITWIALGSAIVLVTVYYLHNEWLRRQRSTYIPCSQCEWLYVGYVETRREYHYFSCTGRKVTATYPIDDFAYNYCPYCGKKWVDPGRDSEKKYTQVSVEEKKGG